MSYNGKLVVIGASSGGVDAIKNLMEALGKDFPFAIAIVQHIHPDAVVDVKAVFGAACEEARDKSVLAFSRAHFAPPGYHLLIERDGTLSLSQDEPVSFSRPSIDVLFESAAIAFGPRTTGLLLTGANSDGAAGLFEIHKAGGRTYVQDPEEASASAMPRSALELFTPDAVVKLAEIPPLLLSGKEST